MDSLHNTLVSGEIFKEFFQNKEFFTIIDREVEPGLYEKEMKYAHSYVTGGLEFYDNTNYINGLKGLKVAKYIAVLQVPDDAQVFVESDQYVSDKLIMTERKPIEEMDIWDKPEIYKKIIDMNPIFINFVKNMPEETMIELLKKFPSYIEHVNNPTDDMILTAVSTFPYYLTHIKNPSLELCIKAVTKAPLCVKYMKNLTDEMYVELINANKEVFTYIDNPTRQMCTMVVMLDGRLVRNIKQNIIDKNLCELAFNNTKEAFQYIPKRFRTYAMCLEAVKYDGTYLSDVPDIYFVEEIMLEAVTHTPGIIKIIKNPCTKLCVEAINRDPTVVKVLDNASIKKYFRGTNDYSNPKLLETIYKILETEPELFEYIPRPTYDICMKAVELDGLNVDFVPDEFLTEELCLKALKTNPYCIKYIKNQTDIYILAAISENPKTIKYITKMTPDLELLAVKINGTAIKHIQNQTDELCEEAIKSNPKALKYIKEQTDKMCKEVIKLNPLYIKYVKKQTYELCAYAIDLDPDAIEHVENQLVELCFMAISKDYKVMKHIKQQSFTFCQFATIVNPKSCEYVKDYFNKKECNKLIGEIKGLF